MKLSIGISYKVIVLNFVKQIFISLFVLSFLSSKAKDNTFIFVLSLLGNK